MIAPPISKGARSGFTLTEMLVVVAIIVVLAGVAVPITLNVLDNAKNDVAVSKAKTLVGAVRGHAARNKEVPATLQDLLAPPNGRGSLTIDAIMDPWENPYQLEVIDGEDIDSFRFAIVSGGSNPGNPARRVAVSSDGEVIKPN